MEAIRLHKLIEKDGQITLKDLPFKKGQSIEMIVLLDSNDKSGTQPLTANKLRTSGLIGLWKDREDITDSAEYARQLRENNCKFNRDLLEKINTAYEDLPDQDEPHFLNRMKIRHKSIVEEQW